MSDFKNSRRDFLGKTWKLTVVGGAGLAAAPQSYVFGRATPGNEEEVEAVKSPSSLKAQLHYHPEDESLGDPIPFFWKGKYHIFYIGGAGWRHIVSTDLVRWKELPMAVPVGAPGEPDSRQCASGSIIERDGTFHIFYLGRSTQDGRKVGTVCHTASRDLIHWKKDPKNPLITPDYDNYAGVTKDPFVFWNEKEQSYWMLIADRLRNAPTSKKGVLALAVSRDLEHWKRQEEPFWAPDNSTSEFEVPDLFEWNGRWYLTYSTYIDSGQSHYRMADQVTGPWMAPGSGAFDDYSYKAVKTISDGKRRFAFGFIRLENPDEGVSPSGTKQAMAIREVIQQPDGSLAFKCPEEILRACGPTIPSKLQGKLGDWSNPGHGFHGKRLDGLAYAVTEGVPTDLLLELAITLGPNTRSAGVLFRTTPDLARGYMVRLEPHSCRVVFERWPKPWPWRTEFWRNVAGVRGKHPFMVQRPLHPNQISWDKPLTIQLLIRGTIAEVFVDNKVALATRIYHHKDGDLGLFVEHGEANFEDITFKALP